MADTNLQLAESVSNPVTSPDALMGKVTNDRIMVAFASILALCFFALYAYKTWLEVKVAKQELKLNDLAMGEYENILSPDSNG